jgi:hypothetical protein
VRLKEKSENDTYFNLDWFKGGISPALPINPAFNKDIWVTIMLLLFVSILVQGITIGKFAKKHNKPCFFYASQIYYVLKVF